MPQFGFKSETLIPTESVVTNDPDANMGSPVGAAGRPCLVTLESGVQALVEISRLAYVEGVPVAVGSGLAEDIDPADWLECGPNGVRFKQIGAPGEAGAIDVGNHSSNVLCLPQRD